MDYTLDELLQYAREHGMIRELTAEIVKTSEKDVSVGGKIKRIRVLRGLTQKQLGLRCGYSDSTADVRISQYESNRKMPREKALIQIADALRVDKSVFYNRFDISSQDCMLYVLFDLEDCHGFHPVLINGKYYIEPRENVSYQELFKEWYEMRENVLEDSDLEKEDKTKRYEIWRFERFLE